MAQGQRPLSLPVRAGAREGQIERAAMPHKYETPQILHDAPLRRDDTHHFHFDEFAVTLCRLIADKNTRTPLTIGVSGSWGSGKTTLLQRVKQMLDEQFDSKTGRHHYTNDNEDTEKSFRSCKTVWFDAWKYADEDHLLAALLRVIVAEMQRGSFWDKVKAELTGPKKTEVKWLGLLLNALTHFASAGSYGLNLDDFSVDTPLNEASAFFDYFDDSVNRLLASWISGKIIGNTEIDEQQGVMVIFIDDLDRCLPEKTVQVLEAIKLFLDKRGCVFVLGADINVVHEAVMKHYNGGNLPDDRDKRNDLERTASDYLEKIVQLPFELPPIVDTQMGKYLADDRDAARVIDAEVRSNWQILVTGADINPRKVKTFINDLNLRWTMLVNSGQAAGVDRNDFTHWNVLMRVAPDNFKRQVNDLPKDSRHKFIFDALKWVAGDETVAGYFKEYESARLLKRVLQKIEFSQKLTPDVLDAFVHLTAPPPSVISASAQDTEYVDKEVAKAALHVGGVDILLHRFGNVEFVQIPKGKFLMGSKDDNQLAFDDEKPQHIVEIPYDYWMARCPVTNEQFAKFVDETAHKFRFENDYKEKADHPVVNVTWHDALEYCNWLNALNAKDIQMPKVHVRLPTEAEWEKAARGAYSNEWPWGNEFDKNRCNIDESGKSGTTSVGAYSPQGDSPYGVTDMVGNVREWCQSIYKHYPYQANDGREDVAAVGMRAVRGGAWNSSLKTARCAARSKFDPATFYFRDLFGFRVVIAPVLE